MKKYIWIFVLAMALMIFAAGCTNRQIIDMNHHFDRVVIYLPNGEIVDGKVQTWTDFDDGDQIQVKVGGKTYLTHSCNVVLIDE